MAAHRMVLVVIVAIVVAVVVVIENTSEHFVLYTHSLPKWLPDTMKFVSTRF